ncbi:MAG TPA: response regulator [Verrucomicrobiae bacterium]|jgi:CheY-like chemotaxis protein
MSETRRKKILLADDDLVVLKVMSLKLQACGYDVVKVSESQDVIRSIGEHLPDLIMMDLNFGPGATQQGIQWDGYKMLDWMNRLEQIAQIPIIIVTAEDTLDGRNRCLAAGAAAYLRKPVDFEELLVEIRRLTGAK